MKYEYAIFSPQSIIAQKRAEEQRDNVGSEVLLLEGLNKLGSEGWELIPWDGQFLGKRESA